MSKRSKVNSKTWESHGQKVRVDQDATGYRWYFLGDLQRPLDGYVPLWLLDEAAVQLTTRYVLRDRHSKTIAESDTAQGIADQARPGTYSFDRHGLVHNLDYCYTVWYRDTSGMLCGKPYRLLSAAMQAVRDVAEDQT